MYNTLTEANEYVSGCIDGDSWAALTDAQKTKYLTAANRLIANNKNYSLPNSATDAMKNAEAELANGFANNSSIRQFADLKAAGISSYAIDDFSVSFKSSGGGGETGLPALVADYLDSYRIPGIAFVQMTRTEIDS